MTKKGERCSDIGLDLISDEDECELAVNYLGQTYQGPERNNLYPTGCYSLGSTAWYNRDQSNNRNSIAMGICIRGIFNHFSRVKHKFENMIFDIVKTRSFKIYAVLQSYLLILRTNIAKATKLEGLIRSEMQRQHVIPTLNECTYPPNVYILLVFAPCLLP